LAIHNFKTRERTDYLVIHCSGSNDDIGAREIRRQHVAKGHIDIGYHYVVRRNGLVEVGRPSDVHGGFNYKEAIVICCIGADELTTEQSISLLTLIKQLMESYPNANVLTKCNFRDFTYPDPTGQPQTGSPTGEPLI
jgi:hypothetical protein